MILSMTGLFNVNASAYFPSEQKVANARTKCKAYNEPHIKSHVDQHQPHAQSGVEHLQKALQNMPTVAHRLPADMNIPNA